MPKLSVVIPVYNVGPYLNKCVESVVGQTFDDLEVILVDDGSSDNSPEICDEWVKDDKRVFVYHIPNGGVSGARNYGISKAKGEYIAFVDGDDWIDSEMYDDLVARMDAGADITFCRFVKELINEGRIVEHYEDNLGRMETAPYDYSKIIYETIYQERENQTFVNNVFGSVCRSLFKKNVIDKYNIRFPLGIRLAEDRLFLMNYLMHCEKAVVCDKYYYHYRIERKDSAVSSMTRGYQNELFSRRKQMLTYEFDIIKNNPNLSEKQKSELIAYEKNKLAFDVVNNELTHNENYKRQLNEFFKDEILKGVPSNKSFSHMNTLGFNLKRRILYRLIQLRMWSFIKMLLRK